MQLLGLELAPDRKRPLATAIDPGIEIMFGRLKDWRRVATRYDRCPTVYFSALALAATVLFWL